MMYLWICGKICKFWYWIINIWFVLSLQFEWNISRDNPQTVLQKYFADAVFGVGRLAGALLAGSPLVLFLFTGCWHWQEYWIFQHGHLGLFHTICCQLRENWEIIIIRTRTAYTFQLSIWSDGNQGRGVSQQSVTESLSDCHCCQTHQSPCWESCCCCCWN